MCGASRASRVLRRPSTSQKGLPLQAEQTVNRRRTRVAAAIAAVSVGLSVLTAGLGAANADPRQYAAMTGVGSDTTQDVMNAIAGEANGNLYPAAKSPSGLQTVSWDALGTACITPKAPGATMYRPNGSTNGARALSRAIDGANSTDGGCGAKPISGLVQYARSSSPTNDALGTALTYIPFGRDALSFAYAVNGVTPVTTLTSAQLTSLFSTGPQIINGVNIIPCGIQSGSGTFTFWNTALGINTTQEATGTASCGTRSQENDASALAAKAAANPGSQVIIGFSAANLISQNNGAAASQLAPGVDLGAIDALGKPYVGTLGSPVTPSSPFYASTTYGRDVYNILPTLVATGPGNVQQKALFVGSTSAICQSVTTIQTFGFLSLGANCGSTTMTGPLRAN